MKSFELQGGGEGRPFEKKVISMSVRKNCFGSNV